MEHEQIGKIRAAYGKAVLQELSKRISNEFGKGFDVSKLRNLCLFYHMFPNWDAVRPELTWTHYRLLLRVESEQARQWYMDEAIAGAWSSRQLDRQISTMYCERLLTSRDREPVKAEAEKLMAPLSSETFNKDPYGLEFLDLKGYPALRETELEQTLIDKLQGFLLELGRGFCFVARQKLMRFGVENINDLKSGNSIILCPDSSHKAFGSGRYDAKSFLLCRVPEDDKETTITHNWFKHSGLKKQQDLCSMKQGK